MCWTYISLTKNQFRTKTNGHQQDVKNNWKEKPIVRHASTHTQSDNCFSSKIVKITPNCKPSQPRRWELSIVYPLQKPTHLNIKYSLKPIHSMCSEHWPLQKYQFIIIFDWPFHLSFLFSVDNCKLHCFTVKHKGCASSLNRVFYE